jgi:hypothetical protein
VSLVKTVTFFKVDQITDKQTRARLAALSQRGQKQTKSGLPPYLEGFLNPLLAVR